MVDFRLLMLRYPFAFFAGLGFWLWLWFYWQYVQPACGIMVEIL